MIKFVVMFRKPTDFERFENAYNDFLALIERMPHIKRRQAVHVMGSPQGAPPYYRGLEIYFEHEFGLRQSLMSRAGQEAGNELARFMLDGFDVYFAEVYEEAGGQTARPAVPPAPADDADQSDDAAENDDDIPPQANTM